MADAQTAITSDVVPAAAAADELERLRQDLVTERQRNAALIKKTEAIDQQKREQISSMRDEVENFVSELGNDFPDFKLDMSPITNWAKTCHTQADPEHQLPLARVLSCASVKVKRTLEQASQKTADAETMGATMKELEALKAENQKRTKNESELEALVRERDHQLAELDAVIKEHKIGTAKFDFSKVSARESAAQGTTTPMQVDSGSAKVKSEDSNLMSLLMSGGAGGGRFLLTAREGHQILSPSAAAMGEIRY